MKRLLFVILALACSPAMAGGLLDIVTKDSTSRSVTLYIMDSSDGTPETGVEYDTAGIALWYQREDGLKVDITEAELTTPDLEDTWETGGFEEIGDGEYRLDVPNAAFATGANYVNIGGTVTGMIVRGGRVRLVDFDLETATQSVNVSQISTDSTAADNLELAMENGQAGYIAADAQYWNATIIDDTLIDLDDLEAEAVDALESFQLDHLMGVTTGAAADADLSTWVLDGSILSHLLTTGADTSNFNASTDSLQSIRDKQTDIEADTSALSSAIISGASEGIPTTTVSASDLTGYLDDELIGRAIIWTGGTAAGQASVIVDYASANGTLTYRTITTAPIDGDTFIISGAPIDIGSVNKLEINGAGTVGDPWGPK